MRDSKNPGPIDSEVPNPEDKERKPFPKPGESDPGDLVPQQPTQPRPRP